MHFKSRRRVFQVKSWYYHRVIEPSEAECSNEFLAGLAYRSKRVMTPSQIYSHDRLRLFGHMLRHLESLEFQSAFMPSGACRFTSVPIGQEGPDNIGQNPVWWNSPTG